MTATRWIVPILGMVVCAVGCGGVTKTVTVRLVTTTVQATTAAATTSSASAQAAATTPKTSTGTPSCRSVTQTFNIKPTRCTSPSGIYFVAATDNHAIRIPGMTVEFQGARTTTSVSDSTGVASAHANGIFLVITLKVTNDANSPQTVETPGTGAFALSPAGSNATFSESFDAENGADQQSFITQDTTPIQPGESQTGDVIFDVPPDAMSLMRHHGAVVVWGGFGQDISSATSSKSSPFGFMVIYHRDLQN